MLDEPMFTGRELHIELENRDVGLLAGNRVNGNILLNLTEPYETKQLNLRLIGVEESSFDADKCGRKEIINLAFTIAEWPEYL